jgi:hypothetical protein
VTFLRRALLVVALGLLLVEIGGRLAVERVVEARLRDSGIAGEVDVVVGSAWWRPSVLPALVGVDLDRIEVRMRRAEVHALPIEVVDYALEDLDVALSVRRGTIGATSVGSGRFRVLVDPTVVGSDVGLTATVSEGRLLVGPGRDPAELRVDGDDLVLSGAAFEAEGGTTRVQIVDRSLLPCRPDVRVVLGMIELWCTADRIPGILEQPLGPGTPDSSDLPPAPVELEPPATLDLEWPSGSDPAGPPDGSDGGD